MVIFFNPIIWLVDHGLAKHLLCYCSDFTYFLSGLFISVLFYHVSNIYADQIHAPTVASVCWSGLQLPMRHECRINSPIPGWCKLYYWYNLKSVSRVVTTWRQGDSWGVLTLPLNLRPEKYTLRRWKGEMSALLEEKPRYLYVSTYLLPGGIYWGPYGDMRTCQC